MIKADRFQRRTALRRDGNSATAQAEGLFKWIQKDNESA